MKLRGSLFLLPILGFCQTLMVSEITHRGNTLTKDYIITREIQHPLDTPLDSLLAEEDLYRLLNLGIFAEVKWRAIPLEKMTVRLEYEIVENNKFFGGRFIGGPSPAYDEETGWSYGAGGGFKNFRGRNEQIGGGFAFGGRNTFAISYFNPWITGDHVSLKLSLAKLDFQHPFLPYDVKIKSIEMNVGRFFGYERKISIGFELEDMDFLNDSIVFNYQYFAPQGYFHYDTRDLYANPTKGILIKQAFRGRINLKGDIKNNYVWLQSFSIYKRLNRLDNPKPLIIALGIKTQSNFGDKDQNFLAAMGEAGSVRGWRYPRHINYNDPDQVYRFGFHNLKASIELRKVIIPRFPIRDLWEFGLTGALYFDWGVNNQGKFKDLLNRQPLTGAGISLQFQIPFVPVLRLEYGKGFYNGKLIDSAFHLAVAHVI